jgi:hypothetical protein
MGGAARWFHYTDDIHPACIFLFSLIFLGFHLDRFAVFGSQQRYQKHRNGRIFRGENILSMPSFGGEVKPSVPCRRFAAC